MTNTTNKKQVKGNATTKSFSQKVNEVAHKEVVLKKIDRDIFARAVMTTSLGINLAILLILIFFLADPGYFSAAGTFVTTL